MNRIKLENDRKPVRENEGEEVEIREVWNKE